MLARLTLLLLLSTTASALVAESPGLRALAEGRAAVERGDEATALARLAEAAALLDPQSERELADRATE